MELPLFLDGVPPYGLPREAKEPYLVERLASLTAHHRSSCELYRRFLAQQPATAPAHVADLPFLPVSVFKEFDLRSSDQPGLSVQSSGTKGVVSRVFVDKQTRKRQQLSALRILSDFLGGERRPYVVFDVESTVRGADAMSARGAAILSVGHLATELLFVMRETDQGLIPDAAALDRALDRIGDQPFVAYGFTYILYQAHEWLARQGWRGRADADSRFLHSGGWKRLETLSVDKPTFNRTVADPWGLPPESVTDFYGLVEQVGVLYPDCSAGRKHVPYWADVVIRRTDSLEPAETGEVGLIQLVSCLPLSAPNHSVLTEDLGMLVGEDDCPCGRQGRTFVFRGRAPAAEVRGCSDAVRL